MNAKPGPAVLLSLMLLLPPGPAGTAHGQVHYRGSGTLSCGLWIEARQTDSSVISVSGLQQMEQWILGYLSAVAHKTGKDVLKDADPASIFRWMDAYCKANVLNRAVGHGVEVLSLELEKKFPRR